MNSCNHCGLKTFPTIQTRSLIFKTHDLWSNKLYPSAWQTCTTVNLIFHQLLGKSSCQVKFIRVIFAPLSNCLAFCDKESNLLIAFFATGIITCGIHLILGHTLYRIKSQTISFDTLIIYFVISQSAGKAKISEILLGQQSRSANTELVNLSLGLSNSSFWEKISAIASNASSSGNLSLRW